MRDCTIASPHLLTLRYLGVFAMPLLFNHYKNLIHVPVVVFLLAIQQVKKAISFMIWLQNNLLLAGMSNSMNIFFLIHLHHVMTINKTHKLFCLSFCLLLCPMMPPKRSPPNFPLLFLPKRSPPNLPLLFLPLLMNRPSMPLQMTILRSPPPHLFLSLLIPDSLLDSANHHHGIKTTTCPTLCLPKCNYLTLRQLLLKVHNIHYPIFFHIRNCLHHTVLF
ncbi:unnamed protein product [Prunus brigantina]